MFDRTKNVQSYVLPCTSGTTFPAIVHDSFFKLQATPQYAPYPPALSRFGPVAADGYGLGYTIDNDRITIPVTAFRGGGNSDGHLMAKEVVRALRDIGDACR